MKRTIAIASFVMLTLCSAVLTTSCEPGKKTINPADTDTLSIQNTSHSMDSAVVSDSSHIKNNGK